MKLDYDLKNFLTWKKRLLIRTVFVLIDVKTESTCFVRSIYLHVSAVFITKQKSLGWSKTSKQKRTFEFIEIHWEKRPIKHTPSF